MTEKSMVEKVRAAMERVVNAPLPNATVPPTTIDLARVPAGSLGDAWDNIARAAIEAMREPTEAMMLKAAWEQASVSGTNYESMGPCNDTDDTETARKAWGAAISEALKG